MYESQGDRDNESVVKEQILELFKYPVIINKLPIAYQLDFGVYRERDKMLIMLLELKSRPDINIDTYPDLILSAHKMHEAVNWYVRGKPVKLIYSLSDGLWSYTVTTDALQLDCGLGGRKDRPDWQDMEPVYHIPRDLLTKII